MGAFFFAMRLYKLYNMHKTTKRMLERLSIYKKYELSYTKTVK